MSEALSLMIFAVIGIAMIIASVTLGGKFQLFSRYESAGVLSTESIGYIVASLGVTGATLTLLDLSPEVIKGGAFVAAALAATIPTFVLGASSREQTIDVTDLRNSVEPSPEAASKNV